MNLYYLLVFFRVLRVFRGCLFARFRLEFMLDYTP